MVKFIYFPYFDLFTIMGLFAPFLMKILPKVVYNTIRYIMVNGKFSTLEKIINWTFWIIIPGISAIGAYLTLLKVFFAISNLVQFCKVHFLGFWFFFYLTGAKIFIFQIPWDLILDQVIVRNLPVTINWFFRYIVCFKK